MNIICDKTLLSTAIDGVSKAVTLRSTIPVLEGILLKAEGFQLTLTGYDLEMGIVTTIEANVKEPGEIVLNAKLLSSMISRMPAGQITIQSADNGKTTIQSGVAQFEIQSMSATDFPELPNTGAEETLTIKTGVLRDMIDRTLYAVSQDEKKPAHTGELFEIEPDKMTIVALDGYRLAIVERPVTAVKDIRIIVPSKTMTEVSHLLPNDDEEPVHICANRRYVVFMTAGYTIMSRLIEGEFLNYHNVIPAGSRTRVTIDTKEFIETIERASLSSVAKLRYRDSQDGISNTFSIVPKSLGATDEDRIENLVTMMDGYFTKGAHHLNVNVLNRDMLYDAMEHPENYPQLTIRVSGYAVNFVKLSREHQLEVISRSFHERM